MYVYTEIIKGIYGILQPGRIMHDKLVSILETFGYVSVPLMSGLWKHKVQPISFTLVVKKRG